jgi:hypothetical protein
MGSIFWSVTTVREESSYQAMAAPHTTGRERGSPGKLNRIEANGVHDGYAIAMSLSKTARSPLGDLMR